MGTEQEIERVNDTNKDQYKKIHANTNRINEVERLLCDRIGSVEKHVAAMHTDMSAMKVANAEMRRSWERRDTEFMNSMETLNRRFEEFGEEWKKKTVSDMEQRTENFKHLIVTTIAVPGLITTIIGIVILVGKWLQIW